MEEPSSGGLDPPAPSRIEAQSQSFESAWRSGSRPRIEDYLVVATAEEAPVLLRRLVRLDIFYRRDQGEQPGVADYQDRFPRLDGRWLSEEIDSPILQRPPATAPDPQQTPATQGMDSTRRAQRVACPHCNCLISVDTSRRDRLVCEECGNSFRLEADETTVDVATRTLGRFRLVERVGRGTFGTVWRAHDPDLDRWVAIKILHPGLVESGEYRTRLLREARTAARLHHPGIVQVHEAPTIDDMPVLISDFITGVTLQEYIKTQRLPFREAADLVADVADALACAHEAGLVHRDIKPGNIMLEFISEADRINGSGKRLRPVVVDFGLAIRPEDEVVLTLTGAVIGTPAYMSPEQAAGHGHRVDGRADIYSLGGVLYELLCGELPFRGSKAMIIHQVLHEEPQAPRRLNDKIPVALETICLKAMSKEPGRRFPTAREMAADLRRFLRGEPIQARPVGRLERTWLWSKRNREVASLIGAVAFLLLGGTTLSSYLAVRMTRFATQARQGERRAEQGEKKALELATRLKEEKLHSDQNSYNLGITLAARNWRDGQAGLVQRDLEKLAQRGPDDPDLRGFEWHYLNRLCRLDLGTLPGHKGRVLAVAYSPDGKVIASAGSDGLIYLWDVADQKQIATLSGHTGAVRSLCFHPRGLELASGGDDRVVRVWDISNILRNHAGQPVHEMEPIPDAITCLAFTPNGDVLAAATAQHIESDGDWQGKPAPAAVFFWNWQTKRPSLSPVKQPCAVWAIAFSADGSRLALACRDCNVPLLSFPSLVKVKTLKGHSRPLRCVAFSPDGKRLASGDTHGEARVWIAMTGEELARFPADTNSLEAVAFSVDGSSLISAGDARALKFWDIDTRSEAFQLPGHAGVVRSMAVSPFGGRRLVSGSNDGTVKLWDTAVSEEAVILHAGDGNESAFGVAFDRSGRLAIAEHSRLRILDPTSGRQIRGWSLPGGNSATSLAFSADRSRLVSSDCTGQVHVWDPTTGKETLTIHAHEGTALGVAISPDDTRIASCGDDCIARIFDARSGAEVCSFRGHKERVHGIGYDAVGRRIATASEDQTVKIWDALQGRELKTFSQHEGAVWAVAFQPYGNLVASGGMEDRVLLWDSDTGKVVHELKGHLNGVMAVCFSPDGRRVATGDWKSVRVWDVATGAELLTLSGHLGPIDGIAFSPDGLRLATSSVDNTVRLWDGSELTSDVLEWRDARSLVRFLHSAKLEPAEMKKRIREDQTISESVREKSLQLAENPP